MREMGIYQVYDPKTNKMYFGERARRFIDLYSAKHNPRIVVKEGELVLIPALKKRREQGLEPIVFSGGIAQMRKREGLTY